MKSFSAIFIALYALIFMTRSINASRVLHQRMIHNVMRSPMSFFDTTPIGRIVNRFSSDIDTIDGELPMSFEMFLDCLFIVLGTLVVISYSTPYFIILIFPLGILYFLIQVSCTSTACGDWRRSHVNAGRYYILLCGMKELDVFGNMDAPGGNKVKIWQKSLKKPTFWPSPTPGAWDVSEVLGTLKWTVQVWLLYHHLNFIYWTFKCTWAEGSSALLWSRIVRRPSIRRPSVRPSSLTFHIFDFSSETTEWSSTKLDRKQDLNVLYQVCVFRVDRKNKMAALASDWLRHFRLLLWNCWREFNETWQEARSQRPLPSLCFSGRSEKHDGRPGLWLAETFLTSPLKPLNGVQRNLTGSKISMSSTKFVFFGSIGKTRWPPWPLIGWDIFDFSSETDERNSTKLDRKQDLNVLYQICVFRVNRKIKMAALASDWLRHFRLLLWNCWTEFYETWQEARSQRPLPSSCFSGRLEKQDGRPGLWLDETFSTSPLKLLNGILLNLTGSKISTSSTKFVFFGSIGKTWWPPWSLIGWDIFDFSSETA